ncbi:hypothetical protein [Bradyrhizobium stylosanthis]|uniref:hypothetical protein n=1 Tax=Bradyrhizobium stylosanthis TaxID=1803665 RepID=UPI0012E8C66A|nr:hypothetical protein [Bradyrhizobium stylosanthis]
MKQSPPGGQSIEFGQDVPDERIRADQVLLDAGAILWLVSGSRAMVVYLVGRIKLPQGSHLGRAKRHHYPLDRT